jgi:PAS domain S-box-containing protein
MLKRTLYSGTEILRQKAEATLQERPSQQVSLTEDETLKLIHELEVHQIELQLLLETTGEDLSFEIREKAKLADELLIANKELLFQNTEKEKRAAELVIANKELFFQIDEKAKRAAELDIANKELDFQNIEKAKQAEELLIANKELDFQNEEKSNRANELNLANIKLQFQNEEKAKRAEELNLANELISYQRDRFEEISSLVPGVVYKYLLRPDGSSCFPYASQAIRQIYRVSPEEVREDATKVFANIHPDDHDEVVNSIQASAKELSPWQHEYRVKFDDGTIRILFGNALPQREVGGSVLWHGFITDITESKLARQQLQDSEARYSSMISNVTDVIAIMDADGLKKYESPNMQKFFGWLPEDTAGKSAFSFIHPDDMEYALKVFYSVLGEDRSVKTLEFRHECKDGSYKPVELIAKNLLNDPLINGLMVSFRDISERKLAQEKLYDSERFFNSIFNSQTSEIAILDETGRVIQVNQKWRDLANANATLPELVCEDANYLSVCDATTGPDAVYAKAMAEGIRSVINKSKTAFSSEYPCSTLGEERWFRGMVTRMEGDGVTRILIVIDNITERKHAEDVIKHSEARYSSMISNISDVIGIMGADGNMTYKSANIEKFFGWLPEERIGTSGFETTHPDDIPKVQNVFSSLLGDENSVKTLEFRYQCKDGTYKPIELTASNQLNNPAINGVLLNYRDISDRKTIEANLEESKEKYRGLSEASFESIFLSEKGVCIEQNLAAELMFGYTSEEALTRYGTDWIVPEDREMVMKNMLSGFEEPYEAMALRKDGSTFPCVLHGRMMQYKGKDVRVTSLNDITARKNAEDKLKLVSTRLSLATVAGGIGIWDYDIVNNTILWDSQMYALYGIKEGDFGAVYETWRAGLHPDDAEQGDREIQMAISGHKEFDTEFRVIWPDQSVHTIRALAITKRDESGQALNMVGTNWDITEQKNAEEALSKARDEAEAANRSKSIFLANMSHEIRTPLNAIIGFSQLLNREQLTDKQKDYSVSIHRSGEHLLKLLNDILELSKIEAGYGKINPVNVDLYALLADIRMMFSQQAQSKTIQLNFETTGNLPQYILVDDNKLRQILINLIGNALKFTDKGEISVRAGIDHTDELKSMLVIEIHDSGTGISEYEIGNLFRQFEQASEGMKQSNGTGLGLALSRELAILMGGNITVSSIEGEGSVFTIRVEIKEGKPETGEDLISRRVIGIDNPKSTSRILVVDDREENLKVVVDFLHWAGFETQEAVNGEDAIARFEQWNPDLILMDIRMPVMNGYEATRWIKATEKGKHVPIVMLSASQLEVDEEIIAGLDIQGFIQKPFRENELFDTISKVLGISYIYQEDAGNDSASGSLNSPEVIAIELAKLPEKLIERMKEAIGKADFYLLIELITQFEPEHPELAKHLLVYANNFDHAYLQNSLNMKEANNE